MGQGVKVESPKKFNICYTRMPFTIPPNPKPVSATTAKIYKSYLNRLAILGIETIEEIVKEPYDTVCAIDILTMMFDDEEERKKESRFYYSAVFYALYGQPILKDPDNELRKGFAKNNPTVLKDGVNIWKSRY